MITGLDPNVWKSPTTVRVKVTVSEFDYVGSFIIEGRHHNVAPCEVFRNVLDDDMIFDTLEEDVISMEGVRDLRVDRDSEEIFFTIFREDGNEIDVELYMGERDSFAALIIGMEILEVKQNV